MPDNESFFQEDKKPAAILKHGILRRYLGSFAGATATTSPGRRVAYLDGFAGEGEYVNERTGAVSHGSPKIALDIAADYRKQHGIQLECTFVEKRRAAFKKLEKVVAASFDPHAIALLGDIEAHLESSLARAEGIPTLVFLDPFGKSLAHDQTVAALAQRDDAKPTELLLNFSLQAVRRFGGRLYESQDSLSRQTTLEGADDWLGGNWWQDIFLDEETMALSESERVNSAAIRVADEYVTRVRTALDCNSFSVDVKRKPSDKPLFLLTLFFPRRIAVFKYNEAVSMGTQDWRTFLADTELSQAEAADALEPRLGLSRVDELRQLFADDEEATKRQAIDDIKDGISTGLSTQPSLHVTNDFKQVFGQAVGVGRETHLRSAWKELAREGVASSCPTGRLEKTTIQRAI